MFKKENRLTKKKDFDSVWKKGRSSFDKILGVKVLKNDFNTNRFGVIIGVKVSKKAVERNKIKRRVREAISDVFPLLQSGFDFSIICLPGSKEKTFSEISESIKNNFKRLKILK